MSLRYNARLGPRFYECVETEKFGTFTVISQALKGDKILFNLEKYGLIRIIYNTKQKCEVSDCQIDNHRISNFNIHYNKRYNKWNLLRCNGSHQMHLSFILNIYLIGPSENMISYFIPIVQLTRDQLITELKSRDSNYVLKIIYSKELINVS